jgi:hypothetical protein
MTAVIIIRLKIVSPSGTFFTWRPRFFTHSNLAGRLTIKLKAIIISTPINVGKRPPLILPKMYLTISSPWI